MKKYSEKDYSIVLCGDKGIGKTTFLATYDKGHYPLEYLVDSNIPENYPTLKIKLPVSTDSKELYTFIIYDRDDPSPRILNDADLFIFCFKDQDSFSNLRKRIKSFQKVVGAKEFRRKPKFLLCLRLVSDLTGKYKNFKKFIKSFSFLNVQTCCARSERNVGQIFDEHVLDYFYRLNNRKKSEPKIVSVNEYENEFCLNKKTKENWYDSISSSSIAENLKYHKIKLQDFDDDLLW